MNGGGDGQIKKCKKKIELLLNIIKQLMCTLECTYILGRPT